MKHQDVKLSNLNDYMECSEAVDAIENCAHNVEGGLKAWCSGKDTTLTKGAKAKIKAIWAKAEKFEDSEVS